MTSKEECTGLVFRGYSNTYYDNGKLEYKQGIRLLKRKSCTCSACVSMLEDLQEFSNWNNGAKIFIAEYIENGRLYTIQYTNFHIDLETGIVDDYDLEIVKI